MPANPADLDKLLKDEGGFDSAYEHLTAYAVSTIQLYAGNTGGRVAVRQLDPEEIVNAAFLRIFTEEFEDENVYQLLRRHIQNAIHTIAKGAKEAKTLRPEGDETPGAPKFGESADPHAPEPPKQAELVDDVEFCRKYLDMVKLDASKDPEVQKVAEAILAGFGEPGDIREVTGLAQSDYDDTMKRLKRRFRKLLAETTKEHK